MSVYGCRPSRRRTRPVSEISPDLFDGDAGNLSFVFARPEIGGGLMVRVSNHAPLLPESAQFDTQIAGKVGATTDVSRACAKGADVAQTTRKPP